MASPIQLVRRFPLTTYFAWIEAYSNGESIMGSQPYRYPATAARCDCHGGSTMRTLVSLAARARCNRELWRSMWDKGIRVMHSASMRHPLNAGVLALVVLIAA